MSDENTEREYFNYFYSCLSEECNTTDAENIQLASTMLEFCNIHPSDPAVDELSQDAALQDIETEQQTSTDEWETSDAISLKSCGSNFSISDQPCSSRDFTGDAQASSSNIVGPKITPSDASTTSAAEENAEECEPSPENKN